MRTLNGAFTAREGQGLWATAEAAVLALSYARPLTCALRRMGVLRHPPPSQSGRSLPLLVREAYHSLRFYDAAVVAVVIGALGDLQQPPPNPGALVRVVVSVLGCVRGEELALLLEGLSKLHFSHRMLTAHVLKMHLRFVCSLVGEGGGGDRTTRSPTCVLSEALQRFLSMVSVTQRFHTQRTTRAFLCCADDCLAASLASFVERHTARSGSGSRGSGGDGNTVGDRGVPSLAGRPEAIDGSGLVHGVLYLFEVYRHASLLSSDAEAAMSPLLAQLLILVCPHFTLAQVLHVLGSVRPPGTRCGPRTRRGRCSAREVTCFCLQQRAEFLSAGECGKADGTPRKMPLCERAALVEQRCRSMDNALRGGGAENGDAVTPAVFLRCVEEGSFLRVMLSGEKKAGLPAACSSWRLCLRDALCVAQEGEESGDAEESPTDGPADYLVFMESVHTAAPARVGARRWERTLYRPCGALVGYAQLQLGLLLLLQQIYGACARDGPQMPAGGERREAVDVLQRATALFRVAAKVQRGDGGAAPQRRPLPLCKDELRLLCVSADVLGLHSTQDPMGRWFRKLTTPEDGETPSQAQGNSLSFRLLSAFLEELRRYVQATLPRWCALLREEQRWLASLAVSKGSAARSVSWLASRMPCATRVERLAMVKQQRELAVASWSLLACILERPSALGSPPPFFVPLEAALQDLTLSLSLCVEDWIRFPCGCPLEAMVHAVSRVWRALADRRHCTSWLRRTLLPSASCLPVLLGFCRQRVDARGPSCLHETGGNPSARSHHRGSSRNGEQLEDALGTPPLEELCLQFLECVLSFPWRDEERLESLHADSLHEAFALLLSLVMWHPLARQLNTALQDWQALQSIWQHGTKRGAVAAAADSSAAGAWARRPPSLPPPPPSPLPLGGRESERADEATLGCDGCQHHRQRCAAWAALASRSDGDRSRATDAYPCWDDSVTGILMLGARRVGQWGKRPFENTLKDDSRPTSLLEYRWQRTDEAYVPRSPLYFVPAQEVEEEEEEAPEEQAVLDSMLRRLFPRDESGEGATGASRGSCVAPVPSASVPPQEPSPPPSPYGALGDTDSCLSAEMRQFLMTVRRDVSLEVARELLRWEELLSFAPARGVWRRAGDGVATQFSCPSQEPYSHRTSTTAFAATLTPDSASPAALLLLRAKMLCSAAIVFVVLPRRVGDGDGDGDEERGQFTRRAVRLVAAVEKQLWRRAPDDSLRSCEAELLELRMLTAAVLEAVLPTLALQVLRPLADGATGSACGVFSACEFASFLRWLTSLFPLPDAMRPLYGELQVFLEEVFRREDTPAPSGRTGSAASFDHWLCFRSSRDSHRVVAAHRTTNDLLHAVFLRFFEAERCWSLDSTWESSTTPTAAAAAAATAIAATAWRPPLPTTASAAGGIAERRSLQTRHFAVFHRTIHTLVLSLQAKGRGAEDSSGSAAVLARQELLAQRAVTSLVLHLTLHNILQTFSAPPYGPPPDDAQAPSWKASAGSSPSAAVKREIDALLLEAKESLPQRLCSAVTFTGISVSAAF